MQRRARGDTTRGRKGGGGGRGGKGREGEGGEEVRGRSGGTAPSEERETSSPIPSSSPGASELGPSAKEIAWDDFPYLRNL